MSKTTIVTTEKLVSCLPGYEDFDTRSIARRLPRKQRVKSIKQLRWEKEARKGKINLLAHAG